MPEGITISAVKDLLSFPFRGEEWATRFVIGAALIFASFFIPILPLILVGGYALDLIRRGARGEAPALPAWSDWGRLAIDGLRALVAVFIYTLPSLVCLLGSTAVYLVGIIWVPLGDPQDPATGLIMLAALAVFMVGLGLGMLLWLLASAVLPVATSHLAVRSRLGAAFQVGEWWPILWQNKATWLAAWVVLAGLYTLVSLVVTLAYYSVVLCCLVPLLLAPAAFYLLAVAGALIGQTYRMSTASVVEPAQATPA
ncbi:MAG: DUF4013 domain-containing protein [Anaerolineae bacterium]|nr:DUF4013 domain-containing protein [Anaerolineae bacterium]